MQLLVTTMFYLYYIYDSQESMTLQLLLYVQLKNFDNMTIMTPYSSITFHSFLKLDFELLV